MTQNHTQSSEVPFQRLSVLSRKATVLNRRLSGRSKGWILHDCDLLVHLDSLVVRHNLNNSESEADGE